MRKKNKPKRLFIAATMQNDGKTTVSLGLMFALKKKFRRISFIKPIGQRYLIEQGYKVDEDSVLIDNICGIKKRRLRDMSPVAIERGFTEKYIDSGRRDHLIEKIMAAFEKVSRNSDLVIIEGTGHAGVGSVFDLSNATVARVLNAKVILVSSGGIGKPIDEIMLNKSLFEREEVDFMGAVINKVLPGKYKKVNKYVRKGLSRRGVDVLGVMPYRNILDVPTVREIHEETKWRALLGKKFLDNSVEKILIGAMEIHDAIKYLKGNTLIITPGDREDIMMVAVASHLVKSKGFNIAALVLTGGIIPHRSVTKILREADIPVLIAEEDTYSAASKVHDLNVKIKPQDSNKIKMAIQTVEKYVDINKIVRRL
jgi:hypothetical protein